MLWYPNHLLSQQLVNVLLGIQAEPSGSNPKPHCNTQSIFSYIFWSFWLEDAVCQCWCFSAVFWDLLHCSFYVLCLPSYVFVLRLQPPWPLKNNLMRLPSFMCFLCSSTALKNMLFCCDCLCLNAYVYLFPTGIKTVQEIKVFMTNPVMNAEYKAKLRSRMLQRSIRNNLTFIEQQMVIKKH